MAARSSVLVPLATALISAIGGAVAAYYGSGAAGGINSNEHRITALETQMLDLKADFTIHLADDKGSIAALWQARKPPRTDETASAKP